jgi:hypothetical protein
MGMLGLFFVCWILFESSRIGIQLQCFIVNPALLALLYCYYKDNKKWIYNLCLFNLLLVIYLIMIINKAHLLIVLPLIITSGVLLVKLAQRTKEDSIII